MLASIDSQSITHVLLRDNKQNFLLFRATQLKYAEPPHPTHLHVFESKNGNIYMCDHSSFLCHKSRQLFTDR